MNRNQLAQTAHDIAKAGGWWEPDKIRRTDELAMLMITEMAEASESVRKREPALHYGVLEAPPDENSDYAREHGVKYTMVGDKAYLVAPFKAIGKLKPEGEAVELADCVIRMLDYAGRMDLHLDRLCDYAIQASQGSTWEEEFPKCPALAQHLDICEALSAFGCHGRIEDESHKRDAHTALAAAFAKIEHLFKLRLDQAKKNGSPHWEIEAWDLERIVNLKMEFNKSRPYRHGNKAV